MHYPPDRPGSYPDDSAPLPSIGDWHGGEDPYRVAQPSAGEQLPYGAGYDAQQRPTAAPPPMAPPPGPEQPGRRRRTSPWLIALTTILAVVAVVMVSLVVVRLRSNNSSHHQSASPATGASSSTQGTAATQQYSAPGGLTVRGPQGWVRDKSNAASGIRDFRDPASPSLMAGQFFRIGIGNAHPAASIELEAKAAAAYLVNSRKATIVLGPSYLTFLSSKAADIEYEFTDSGTGVQRHGIERIFIHDGATLIIAVSGPVAQTEQVRKVFQQLVGSAKLG